jgi:predicted nucleotidyltransferase component of viral defense system
MIDRLEIMEFSGEVGPAPEVVEKDYVLGLVLGGIFNHSSLRNDWLFKGGTCLKNVFLRLIASPKTSISHSDCPAKQLPLKFTKIP